MLTVYLFIFIRAFHRTVVPFHRKNYPMPDILANLADSMANRRQRRSGGTSLTDLMIFRRRWWQHLLFWGTVIFILLNIFKTSGSLQQIDLIYTLLFTASLATAVYLNLYLAIPLLLTREKYLWYFLSLIFLAGAGACWIYNLFDRWIDFILPRYYFISYYTVFQLLIFTGSILLLTTLLKLSRSWFMMLRLERLEASHQLSALQHQINPHFLLNSIQTIYALSLERSDKTPGLILQLSDILKYTLYETDQPRVKLEKEIAMVRDYVQMYRYRVDPERVRIRLEVTGEAGPLEIAPLLLIPFVENCFKHGLHGGPDPAEITIHIHVDREQLEFMAVNSLGVQEDKELEPPQGIGIRNTKQRLEMLYPGNHTLKIVQNSDHFRVNLKIKLEPWDRSTVSS